MSLKKFAEDNPECARLGIDRMDLVRACELADRDDLMEIGRIFKYHMERAKHERDTNQEIFDKMVEEDTSDLVFLRKQAN